MKDYRNQIAQQAVGDGYRREIKDPSRVKQYWWKTKSKANGAQHAVKKKFCNLKFKSSSSKEEAKANEGEDANNRDPQNLPQELRKHVFSFLQLHEADRILRQALPLWMDSWAKGLPADSKKVFDAMFSGENIRYLSIIRRSNGSKKLYRLNGLNYYKKLGLNDPDSEKPSLSDEQEATHTSLDYSKVAAMYILIALLCTIRDDLRNSPIKKYKWEFRDATDNRALSTRDIMVQVHQRYGYAADTRCASCLQSCVKSKNSPLMPPLSKEGLKEHGQGHRAVPYLVIYPEELITILRNLEVITRPMINPMEALGASGERIRSLLPSYFELGLALQPMLSKKGRLTTRQMCMDAAHAV